MQVGIAFDPPEVALKKKVFEDKSGAINHETGICDKLSNMLQLWCRPGQKLAVGKPEYKTIIEAQLVGVKLTPLVLSLKISEYHLC
jgi:hypothetical protein